MINLRHMKLSIAIKTVAGFATGVFIFGGALLIDSPDSHAGMKPKIVTYTSMQPDSQTKSTLPKPRPDPLLAYDLQPVEITLPHAKPSMSDILPSQQ